jgi:dTDP-4-amino-4,6-dideoxygalactose transaminase
MHYGGYACNMDAIMGLAREHEIPLIEDAAHAPGAELNGRKLGAIGDAGCFSFFSNKNLAVGEGGMIVTDRDDLADRIRRLRSHGMTSSTWERHRGDAFSYDVVEVGLNYRIDEIRSALGLAQLRKLDESNRVRRMLTSRYRTVLGTEKGLSPTCSAHPGLSSAHLFAILLDPGVDRGVFMQRMEDQGIQTSIHYPPTHTFSCYRERGIEESLPVTEQVGERIVSLPLYGRMSAADVDLVASAIPWALGRV